MSAPIAPSVAPSTSHLAITAAASAGFSGKNAREFEAYFISHLLKVMRETVPKGALENKGGAYFYSFYDQEISRLASEAGGIGLAKMIHEYTEKNASTLKFSEPVADTIVDKDHRPSG